MSWQSSLQEALDIYDNLEKDRNNNDDNGNKDNDKNTHIKKKDNNNTFVVKFHELPSESKTFNTSNLLEFGIPKSRFFKFQLRYKNNFQTYFVVGNLPNNSPLKNNTEYEYKAFTTIINKKLKDTIPKLVNTFYDEITPIEERTYTIKTQSVFGFDYKNFTYKIIQIIQYVENNEEQTLISISKDEYLFYSTYRTKELKEVVTDYFIKKYEGDPKNYVSAIIQSLKKEIIDKLFEN